MILKRLKKTFSWLLALFAVLAFIAISWSMIPIESGVGKPDPAVEFANQNSPPNAQLTESYFRYKELDLHYVEAGRSNAEAILFVHGFPQFWYSFIHQIDGLSTNYRVIAIDGLGAGLSSAPSDIDSYKLANMAEHIDALLKKLNVQKVHLVGHDWGGAMVFGFAQKYPERVKSVTGISAPPQNIMLELLMKSSSQQAASSYVEKLKGANSLLLIALRASRRLWESLYLPLIESGNLSREQGRLMLNATGNVKRFNAHINWYRANLPEVGEIQDSDYWPTRSATLNVPAMLIWGTEDRVFDVQFIDKLNESAKQLTVLKLDGVGHSPHLEQAEKVTTAIGRFINENP